jgi:ATP-binding protein involved in chromosome partitioning
LAKVKDPGLGRDLIAAGMVRDVRVEDGLAHVGIRLTTPLCPSREAIAIAVKTAVEGLDGVKAVDITFAAEVARKDGPLPAHLPTVRNVIAVAAGKGGVGKSTVATNLAAALAKEGAAVGIMDTDVFGPSIPQMMGPPQIELSSTDENKIIPAVHHGIKIVSVGFFVERGAAVIWLGPMIHKLLSHFVSRQSLHWTRKQG